MWEISGWEISGWEISGFDIAQTLGGSVALGWVLVSQLRFNRDVVAYLRMKEDDANSRVTTVDEDVLT